MPMYRASPGLFATVAWAACGATPAQDRPAAPIPDSPPRDDVAPAAADPACEQAARPPALTHYDAITDGTPFSLAMVEDAGAVWGPVTRLEMPLHHASTIAWQGLELLEAHRGKQVVVIATGLGRTSLEHDPDRNTWFATYAARIDRVCA